MEKRVDRFPIIEPWEQPVSTRALLDELAAIFAKYVSLTPASIVALTLWVLHTYALDATDTTPRLAILSPEPRCGKTTLLKLLHTLVFRAEKTDNTTPAALFRNIAAFRPTLLVDELDSYVRDNEALRGIINSGHQHDGFVSRADGENHIPRQFPTFAALALAAIGTLPATVIDRSIVIRMKRKLPVEIVSPLRRRERTALAPVRQRITRWADDNLEHLRFANEAAVAPQAPASLDDRAQDNWEPLFVIADLAGKGWSDRARQAAVELSRERIDTEQEGTLPQLLSDIYSYFNDTDSDDVGTKVLLNFLHKQADRPWSIISRGEPLTDMHLARLLRPYGIRSRDVRGANGVLKSYVRTDFAETFKRYLQRPATAATLATESEPTIVAAVASVASLQKTNHFADAPSDETIIARVRLRRRRDDTTPESRKPKGKRRVRS